MRRGLVGTALRSVGTPSNPENVFVLPVAACQQVCGIVSGLDRRQPRIVWAVCGSNDDLGAAINHAIPDVSCHRELIVAGSEHRTSHTYRQGLNALFSNHKPSGMQSVAHRHETYPSEAHHDCHIRSASSSHRV
jgi:hypothetical protein